ncbi:MAG TPA: hypothetical protein DDW90_07335 [Cyanobacteria bacterium UBA9971]|nr:hypothetical protein [Cyanobacteria bacterium UBA9971]
MSRAKNKLILISLMMFFIVGLTGCAKPPFMGKRPPMPVETTVLKASKVMNSEIYQANLISRYSVVLQPQVSGQVANIYVKAGEHVKTGQLLMVIDKRKQESALNSSQAASSAAKAALYNYQVQRKILESTFEYNKQMYERYKTLYAKNTVSKQDLEKYTDSYNKAQFDLEANAAQIEAQKAEIEKANFAIKEQEVQLQYYKITAPYSGIVGDIPAKIGNYVTTTTPLLSITQNDTLEINIGLPSEKVFDIKKGLPVEVLDNKNNVISDSKISFVSPVIDKDTQTILVKAIIFNPDGLLKADQSVKARVVFSDAEGITAPTGAIAHFGGQDFAYIIKIKDKKPVVKQQPVTLGNIQGDKYVILSGLASGDKIVTQGIQKLMDGAPVTVMGKGN